VAGTEPSQERGQRTRARLLEAAAARFAERGFTPVTVAEIAQAAEAHPNQVTYYFGSKEGLFVQAAFLLMLRQTEHLESVGGRQQTPAGFCRALARVALHLPAVPTAVEAMAVARQKPGLEPALRNGLRLLFHQSEAFLARTLARHGWVADRPLDVEVKTFWSTVLGARLISESGFGGQPADIDLAGVLTIRENQDPSRAARPV
jgi:AcrR family transcriptional regulator